MYGNFLFFLPVRVRRLRDLFHEPINLLGFSPKRHAMIGLFLADSDLNSIFTLPLRGAAAFARNRPALPQLSAPRGTGSWIRDRVSCAATQSGRPDSRVPARLGRSGPKAHAAEQNRSGDRAAFIPAGMRGGIARASRPWRVRFIQSHRPGRLRQAAGRPRNLSRGRTAADESRPAKAAAGRRRTRRDVADRRAKPGWRGSRIS